MDTTIGTLLLVIILQFIYIITHKHNGNVKQLIRKHRSLSARFIEYKKDLYSLTKHLAEHVDERNVKINDVLKEIEGNLKKIKDIQDFINIVYIRRTILSLEVSILNSEDELYIERCTEAIKKLRSLIRSDVELLQATNNKVSYIRDSLAYSNNYVKENAVSMLLQLSNVDDDAFLQEILKK